MVWVRIMVWVRVRDRPSDVDQFDLYVKLDLYVDLYVNGVLTGGIYVREEV